MILRPPVTTRTDTTSPNTTLSLSRIGMREAAGDVDALLLAAGEGGGRQRPEPLRDTQPRQQFARSLARGIAVRAHGARSEEHTSELQSLMRISYAVLCLKKETRKYTSDHTQLTR